MWRPAAGARRRRRVPATTSTVAPVAEPVAAPDAGVAAVAAVAAPAQTWPPASLLAVGRLCCLACLWTALALLGTCTRGPAAPSHPVLLSALKELAGCQLPSLRPMAAVPTEPLPPLHLLWVGQLRGCWAQHLGFPSAAGEAPAVHLHGQAGCASLLHCQSAWVRDDQSSAPAETCQKAHLWIRPCPGTALASCS